MIVAAILTRNEADRYLARVLDALRPFCDTLLVVDDGSTDLTREVALTHGAVVCPYDSRDTLGGWWGEANPEGPKRSFLWQEAARRAGPDGWVFVCDADQYLVGISPEDLRKCCECATFVNAWSCVLWDAWDDEAHHRVDGYWQAWRNPRPWIAKAQPTPGFVPAWGNGTIHVGHLPSNFPLVMGLLPPPAGILHLAYVTPADRARKRAQYAAA